MKAIWSGALSFGLIIIPVKLYSGSEQRTFSLRLLERHGKCPIGYVKVCKENGKAVSNENIVKGYEYQKGDYVVIEDEDFERAQSEKRNTIDIVQFSNEKEINSKLYDKPYYLEPDKTAEKAYVLLREALLKSGKVGIAKYVLRKKEHIGVLKPEKDVLILNQLRYAHELRGTGELVIPLEKNYSKQEFTMAVSLIDQMTAHFKARQFKDTYTSELKKVIEEKAKGKKPGQKGREPQPTDMTRILEALRNSLEQERVKETA